jgi:hypothetical protein
MDAESFKGKVALSIIDKVLIGGALYLVFLLCNGVYDEYQREREQAIAVSKVHTEILAQQRSDIVNQIQTYIEIENQIGNDGVPSRELVAKLGDHVSQMRLAAVQVRPVAPELGPILDSLTDDMSSLYRLLNPFAHNNARLDSVGLSNREKLKATIMAEYKTLLERLRKAAVNSIKDDISSSK